MEETNGKVTLALLGQKMDYVTATVERQEATLDELLKHISVNKECIALNKQWMERTAKDLESLSEATNKSIDALEDRVNKWSAGNTFLGGLAAILAVILGTNK